MRGWSTLHLAGTLGLVLVLFQGCAAAGLALLGVGAGVAAGTGTDYTLNGIAYRTFPEAADTVHQATLASLRRLDVKLTSDNPTDSGRKLVGQAGDREIDIELERLTTRATRMRVTAKQGFFFRDRSTAGEIIAQTEQAMDNAPAPSRKLSQR